MPKKNKPLKEELYVSKREAARLLGLNAATFSRWWNDGRLPLRRYNVNRVVRFLKAEVEYLMESWSVGPPEVRVRPPKIFKGDEVNEDVED